MDTLHVQHNSDGSFTLTCSLDLPYPLEEVFSFFSKPENLSELTPSSMGLRVLTPAPIVMEAGTVIVYRIRPMGLPMKWVSRIDTWDPPHEFTDIMEKGPFASWAHSHRFQETESGTRVEDHVTYRVPGGRWMERLLVRKQLTFQFEYRSQKMMARFPALPRQGS